ncbi:MAG: fused MFS/spermidine synthase [Acidobacteria bacterium]|nr:fused MFS/spermidine synthase [Acidobacteriota bacterium]
MPKPTRTGDGLAAVVALLFLSGAGSLVLEVTWSRLLRLVFGSTTLAISTILVAYMLGLGLGGLFGGRWAARLRDGVRAYAVFELVVGGYALAVPLVLGLYPALDRAVLGALPFWPAALVRFVLALAVLVVPTFLMGATLPVLVEGLVRGPRDISRRLGLLYGINTLGAVAGTLGATFVLFPALGVRGTNAAGAALDLAAGALALFVVAPRRRVEPASPSPARAARDLPRWNPVLVSYGVVGFASLALEVVWTRALAMVTGSSVHAFAAMLAAFLAGIALGSLAARRLCDRLARPLPAYAAGVALVGLAPLATIPLFERLPDWILGVYVALGADAGPDFVAAGFAVSVATLLGPALLLGALFPLAARALADRGRPNAQVVGDIYFVNTIGAAAGAFVAGFALVPQLGLLRSLHLLSALLLVAAAVVFAWQREWNGRLRLLPALAAALAALAALAVPPHWDQEQLTRGVYYRPRESVDVGPATEDLELLDPPQIVFYRDGLNTTMSVHRSGNTFDLRVNGKPDASLADMPTQVLLAQAPALFGPPRAGNAMVVGLASGITAGSLALHPLRRIDVLEIEPASEQASHFFDEWNNRPLARPNVRLIADDGRSWLATTRERYDIIVSEPSNPFITGVANLFTREFFASVHRALAPGGRFCQWLQLYGLDAGAFRSILAALQAEFPYVYALHPASVYPDLIVLAGESPLRPDDLPRWEALPAAVRRDLERAMTFSTADLWSLVRLVPRDITALTREASVVNTDDNMFVELHAPFVMQARDDEPYRLLDSQSSGVLGLFGDDAALPAGVLDELAASYAGLRGEPAIARRVIDRARAGGGAGAGLVAEALLAPIGNPENVSRALQLLDRAVALDPAAFDARLFRARFLLEQRARTDLPTALDDANAALAARPGDLRALKLRLQICNRLRLFEQARDDAEVLLRSPLAGLDDEIWAESAWAAAELSQWEPAIRDMRLYLARNPNTPGLWNALTRCYEQTARPELAARARENAARAARNRVLVEHRAARREAAFGDRAKARAMLDAILARDPGYTPARDDLRSLSP